MDGVTHTDAAALTFSLVTIVALLGAGFVYSAGVARQHRMQKQWSQWRSLSFWAGIGVLVLAVSPTTLEYAHRDLRGHMAQHLLIGMLAPVGLVLAAPVSLLLRSVSTASARSMARVMHSLPIQVLSLPAVAMLLNVGAMYVLYLTPLYAATLEHRLLHYWLHAHFLVAGYLFTWAILAGPDPGIRRVGLGVRLAVLWLSIASHALLAKLMYGFGWPRDTHHSLQEIQAAAKLMYYGGDAAELLLVIALFAMWYAKLRR